MRRDTAWALITSFHQAVRHAGLFTITPPLPHRRHTLIHIYLRSGLLLLEMPYLGWYTFTNTSHRYRKKNNCSAWTRFCTKVKNESKYDSTALSVEWFCLFVRLLQTVRKQNDKINTANPLGNLSPAGNKHNTCGTKSLNNLSAKY